MDTKHRTLALVLVLLAAGCGKTETPVAAASAVPQPAGQAAPAAAAPLVKVPDLTSSPHFVVDGILALQEKGFAVAVTQRQEIENRPGYIIDQAPDGFASRPKGSVIRLTVATLPGMDLALSKEEAQSLTAQTADKLRKKLAGDDSQVLVPQVEGRNLVDAILALQQRGFKAQVDVINPDKGGPALARLRVLTVASQGPAANSIEPAGTEIELKCLGREIVATREQLARLSRTNQSVLRRARAALEAYRATKGKG